MSEEAIRKQVKEKATVEVSKTCHTGIFTKLSTMQLGSYALLISVQRIVAHSQ